MRYIIATTQLVAMSVAANLDTLVMATLVLVRCHMITLVNEIGVKHMSLFRTLCLCHAHTAVWNCPSLFCLQILMNVRLTTENVLKCVEICLEASSARVYLDLTQWIIIRHAMVHTYLCFRGARAFHHVFALHACVEPVLLPHYHMFRYWWVYKW